MVINVRIYMVITCINKCDINTINNNYVIILMVIFMVINVMTI